MVRLNKDMVIKKLMIKTVLLAAFIVVLFTSPAFASVSSHSEVDLSWDTVSGWEYEPLASVTVTVENSSSALKGMATTMVGAEGYYEVTPQNFNPHGSFDIKTGDKIIIEVGGTEPVTETIIPNLTAFTSATKDAIYIESAPEQNIEIYIDRYKDGNPYLMNSQATTDGACAYQADYDILPADYFYVSYTEANGNVVYVDPIAPYGMVGLTEDTVWGYYYQPQTPVTVDVYSGPNKLGSAQATTDGDGYFKVTGFDPQVDIKNGYSVKISSGYEDNSFGANLKAAVDFNTGTISGKTVPDSYMISRVWPAESPNNYFDSTATADRNGVFSIKTSPGLHDAIMVASIHPNGNITRSTVVYGTESESSGQLVIYSGENNQDGATIKTQEIRPGSLSTTTASNDVSLKILTDGVRFSTTPQAIPLGVGFDSPDATLSEDSKTAVWHVSDATTSTAGKILFTGIYYDVDTETIEGPVQVEVAGNSGVTTETVVNARIRNIRTNFGIKGKVIGEDGLGINGAKIHLFAGSNPMGEIVTSPDGVYEFQHLISGNYKIATTRLGYTTSQFETDLASDISDQDFVLKKTDIGLVKPEGNGVQAYEQIENILADLGYPDVSVVTTDDLTNVQELNTNLHSLFIDSSPLTFNATQTATIKDFVNNGGSLYASDMSYSLVGQAFPGSISFNTSGITTPQTIATTIRDKGFADYLNPSQPATSLALSFNDLMTPWIAIDSVAPGSDIFVSGNIAMGDGAMLSNKPLAVAFRSGKGRVVYSSYFCSTAGVDEYGRQLLKYLALNTLVGAEVNRTRDALVAGGYDVAKVNVGLATSSDTPSMFGYSIEPGKDMAVDLWWRTGPLKLSVVQSDTVEETTSATPPASIKAVNVPEGSLTYSATVLNGLDGQTGIYPSYLYVIAVGTKATTPQGGGDDSGSGGGDTGSGGGGNNGGSSGGGGLPGGNGQNGSNDDTETHNTIDGKPANLMANQGKDYVSLNWSGISDPDIVGYNIYRKDSKSGIVEQLNDVPVAVTFFEDNDVEPNDTYYYVVTAVNTNGYESDPSDVVKITTVAVLGDVAFADVPVNAWYKNYISKLTAAGIINGYNDGSFKPQNYVTRAEFCKLVLAAIGEKPLNGMASSFSDVSSHWAQGYIEKARQLGIIDGYKDGTFKPNARVTRAEISKMICSAKEITISKAPSGFSDCGSCWADRYISSLKASGIIAGYSDGTFKPQNSATRAEVCKIIALMMQ